MATIRKRQGRSLRTRDGLIRHAFDKTSQHGEDGIIQRLFELLPSANQWCVDVGALDGKHTSNTYSLLEDKGWSGVLIEADMERFQDLQKLHPNQCCLNAAVSCQPSSPYAILPLLQSTPLPKDFNFLCIDVDGSDYWLLQQTLSSGEYSPKVICVKFNPTMPNDLIYIPPCSDDDRQGASLAAFVELCEQYNYVLVETTLYNGFFVPSTIYQDFLVDVVPDTSIEALHEVIMGTQLYQLMNGTLKVHGCKELIWHQRPIEERKLQMLDAADRIFPFASTSASDKLYRDAAVDVSAYDMNGSPEGNRCITDALWQQLQDTGFCLIRGTGISPTLCSEALESCHEFLNVASEDVRRSTLTRDRARRGYSPMCTENFASLIGERGVPNDVVRKFRVGPLEASGESSLLQPNVWPTLEWEHSETFRSSVSSYFDETCKVAEKVVRAICEAVELRTDSSTESSLKVFFEENSRNTSILTLLGYRVGARHKRKQPLVASHTDVGVATMLLFDAGDCATLQRSVGDESWVDVSLPSKIGNDAIFVVNIGDCLSDLSGGLLPSTLHRVMPQAGKNPRSCLALFVGLEPEQELRLPRTGEVITYESWRKQRIARAQSVLS